MRLALPVRFQEQLASLPDSVTVTWYSGAAECPAAVAGAQVLWLEFGLQEEIVAALEAGPDLRWVFTPGAGMDRQPLATYRERGIILTNGAGLASVPIAEYTVMAILAAAKGLPALLRAQDRAEWLKKPPGRREVLGSKALIVGYGNIGRAIAERLLGFGVEVTGVRRRPDSRPEVIGPGEWRTRIGEFDWVILGAPPTAETAQLIGPAELAGMKDGAWLLNISRGALVDQDALISALKEGRIGGAYLDVTDPEPLPAASELWKLPNVIITPHSSWASERFSDRSADLFLDNLVRFQEGRELLNVVDLEAGY